MAGFQRDRQLGGQNFAAGSVDHGGQVRKAFGQRNIGRSQCPGLIGAINRHTLQQVRVNLMSRLLLTGIGFAVERRDPHPLHQGFDMLAAHRDAFSIR